MNLLEFDADHTLALSADIRRAGASLTPIGHPPRSESRVLQRTEDALTGSLDRLNSRTRALSERLERLAVDADGFVSAARGSDDGLSYRLEAAL